MQYTIFCYNRQMKLKTKSLVIILALLFIVNFVYFTNVSAHEVYVLNSAEIAHDVAQPPLNLFAVALSHEALFFTSTLLGLLLIITILGISLSRGLERLLDPILFKIKPYAAHIAQITVGSALFASAYYGALFGVELPLVQLFGHYTPFVTGILYVASASLLLGIYPRFGGLCLGVIYIAAIFSGPGVYMLSYLTYFAEGGLILFFGAAYSLVGNISPLKPQPSKFYTALKNRSSFILRMCFSSSLIYAAFYAKLIHGTLALDTVNKYHLTNYFHFAPLFIVLGAFMIEIFIAIFYLIGFEIRFTSLFFLTFLTMSLIFFGEAVWPHIILIGTAIGLFVHGYDEYTIEHSWYKKGKREPVL